jgi:hypothetical protein
LVQRKPEAFKQSNKSPNQNHIFIVRTLTISQPNARVLLLLLTAKRSFLLNSYALTVQGKVIKHLNVEANWDVAIASEDITPRFVKVKPPLLVATGEGAVVYPIVVVEVDGIMCIALLDTGAGSSYASATLLARLNTSPVRKEYRRIETLMQSSTKMIEVHKIKIDSVEENFHLDTEVTINSFP